MKYIIGNRQSGVTTDLILEANKFGSAILVPTDVSKDFIKHKCDELGIKCPDIFSVGDILRRSIDYNKYTNFVVNDINMILCFALRELGMRGTIDTCGVSLDSYK